MSIVDYSDLLIAVGEYTGRDDFTHLFPRFVSAAEGKLSRRLRVAGMETEAEITAYDAGADIGKADLPTDYLEMRMVRTASGSVLEALSAPGARAYYGPFAGVVRGYYIENGLFVPLPFPTNDEGWDIGDWDEAEWDAIATFTINYYAAIPALSATNESNWLLASQPMTYLYATMAEVLIWAVASGRETDAGKVAAVNALLDTEINAIQHLDGQKRYSNLKFMTRGLTP